MIHSNSLSDKLQQFANSSKGKDSPTFKAVKVCFHDHLRKYPDMQIQDIYKFVFQGVMGSGHAIHNESVALERFQRELCDLDELNPAEEIVELLSPEFVRVNLRPYVKIGENTEALFEAFIRTGETHRGSLAELCSAWKLISGVQKIFRQGDLEMYFARQRIFCFPSVHHSEIYSKLYRPAYRVISVKELSSL